MKLKDLREVTQSTQLLLVIGRSIQCVTTAMPTMYEDRDVILIKPKAISPELIYLEVHLKTV